jgi:hypothetical protein
MRISRLTSQRLNQRTRVRREPRDLEIALKVSLVQRLVHFLALAANHS